MFATLIHCFFSPLVVQTDTHFFFLIFKLGDNYRGAHEVVGNNIAEPYVHFTNFPVITS